MAKQCRSSFPAGLAKGVTDGKQPFHSVYIFSKFFNGIIYI